MLHKELKIQNLAWILLDLTSILGGGKLENHQILNPIKLQPSTNAPTSWISFHTWWDVFTGLMDSNHPSITPTLLESIAYTQCVQPRSNPFSKFVTFFCSPVTCKSLLYSQASFLAQANSFILLHPFLFVCPNPQDCSSIRTLPSFQLCFQYLE